MRVCVRESACVRERECVCARECVCERVRVCVRESASARGEGRRILLSNSIALKAGASHVRINESLDLLICLDY